MVYGYYYADIHSPLIAPLNVHVLESTSIVNDMCLYFSDIVRIVTKWFEN